MTGAEGAYEVLTSRNRAALLGLLATMLVGSVMASSASAALAPGPFWHHRAKGGTGEGAKIEPATPENFRGTGGKQTLLGKVGATEIEIASRAEQVKGAIFNATNQGQIKLSIVYVQPELIKPALANCSVVVGTNNIVQVKGHLMWKWNGESSQLLLKEQRAEQVPDLVFSAVEPTQQTEELKTGTFATITLVGTGCGVLGITSANVTGAEVGITNRKLEEWNTNLSVFTPPTPTEPQIFRQHFWDGTAFKGTTVQLQFDNKPASLIGQTEVESEQQEIAVFEN